MKIKNLFLTGLFSCALSFGILLGVGSSLKAKAVLADPPADIPDPLPSLENVAIYSNGLVT